MQQLLVFLDVSSFTILQVWRQFPFIRCFWHGYRACHPQRTDVHPTLLDWTMDEVRDLIDKKRVFLQNLGCQVVDMWECSCNALKNSNQVLAHLDLQAPLEPWEYLCGCRTNAVHLYAQAEDREEIRYDEYTSLYPWVNKYGEYPIGHPTFMYVPNIRNLSPYFGLAKCTVLPPQRLCHPVLPYRSHDKLTFPLFRTGSKTTFPNPCWTPNGPSKSLSRDLVHLRTRGSRTKRVHDHAHPRSVAFRRKAQGTLSVLHGHVAKDQGRSQWMA